MDLSLKRPYFILHLFAGWEDRVLVLAEWRVKRAWSSLSHGKASGCCWGVDCFFYGALSLSRCSGLLNCQKVKVRMAWKKKFSEGSRCSPLKNNFIIPINLVRILSSLSLSSKNQSLGVRYENCLGIQLRGRWCWRSWVGNGLHQTMSLALKFDDEQLLTELLKSRYLWTLNYGTVLTL